MRTSRFPAAPGLRLALGLGLGLLGACGGGSSGDDDDDTPIDAPATDDSGNPIVDAAPAPDAPPLPVCEPVTGVPTLDLQVIASDLDMPVFVTSPPGDPRLFVLEKKGSILLIKDGVVQPTPFLTIDVANVSSLSDERGLLGLAFHPQYATNRKFYVFYMDNSSDHVVAEYQASAVNPDVADPTSYQLVLHVDDIASNHNGGMLDFGPDGYLYIGIGDGGGANDTAQNGQNLDVAMGKILRLDVATLPYTIPADNPFAGATPGLDEIWSYGWRNPWRWSFDRETGDMYVGDVGQDTWEEVSIEPADAPGGLNYGWRIMEGNHCRGGTSGCDMTGKVPAAFEYAQAGSPGGCTVIGGYVYRGCRMPDLHGTYFLADYCNNWVRSFEWTEAGGVANVTNHPGLATDDIVSFGQDAQGELYIVSQGNGQVLKIVPQP
jgi:glucose/arabinose dehydrogenase